jgi:arylsulfatase A-like enzyme
MTRHDQRPNVVLILADDLGYSDIGCYGGEIDTPNLDRLAAGGLRMSQFYNTARCSPSRASLLTGLHPHQTGIGILVEDQRPHGYQGSLNDRCVTVAEVLRSHGYGTYMSGKWHLTGNTAQPDGAWPTERGFDRFYGTLAGAGSYYNPATLTRDTATIPESQLPDDWIYTDAISDQAAAFIDDHIKQRARDPFFLYVAYTTPHWPLHAPPDDIETYAGRYDQGWDQLRARRMQRLIKEGLLDPATDLSQRDPDVAPWDEPPHHQWEAMRMQTYAAQVTRMDVGIGRIIDTLESQGQLDNTMLIFLSDNGGSAEGQPLGYVDEALDARPNVNRLTRAGERVYGGNTPKVAPGPESTWHPTGEAGRTSRTRRSASTSHGSTKAASPPPSSSTGPNTCATPARSGTPHTNYPTSWRPSSTPPTSPTPATIPAGTSCHPKAPACFPPGTVTSTPPPANTRSTGNTWGTPPCATADGNSSAPIPTIGNSTTSQPTGQNSMTKHATTQRSLPNSPPHTKAGQNDAASSPANRFPTTPVVPPEIWRPQL